MAAVCALPAGVWLVLRAPAGEERLATAVFAATITAMFAASALTHARRWPPRTTEILFRLDHTAIYLAIAGSATPLAVLGLEGWPRSVLLWGSWLVAGVGILLEWLPFAAPRGYGNTVYLTTGWLSVVLLPWISRQAGFDTVVWLVAGGVLYTVGAAIVGLRRPDPDPEVFGYHEIWHLLVVAAVATHYYMVAGTLL